VLWTLLALGCSVGSDATVTGTDSDPVSTDSGSTGSECLVDVDTGGVGGIDETCCLDAAAVELRGGTSDPVELTPSGLLPIGYTPQYGWELQLFPRVCHTRDQLELRVELVDVDTSTTLTDVAETVHLVPVAEGSCCGDAWLRLERLDVRDIPEHQGKNLGEILCDREVQVTVTATDSDGREGRERLELVFFADPDALGHDCGQGRAGS